VSLRIAIFGICLWAAGWATALGAQPVDPPRYLDRATRTTEPRACQTLAPDDSPELLLREVFPDPITKTPGRDKAAAALFLPIRQVAEPMARLGAACLDGQAAACQRFQTWMKGLVDTDALRFDREKHRHSSVSLVSGALSGNITVRPIATYAEALRRRGLLNDIPAAELLTWFDRRIADYDHYPARLSPASAQNLVLNAVAARLAVMSMTGQEDAQRQEALRRAEAVYKLYLDTARPDGSFPAETRRGLSALKYSNMAVGLLVAIAEMASDHGVNLYDHQSSAGVSIHTAIAFLLQAMQDDAPIQAYAAENFAPTDPPGDGRQNRHFTLDHLHWMGLYQKRHPGHPMSQQIEKVRPSLKEMRREHLDEITGLHVGCGR
jgi:hypothetical protein